MTKLTIPILITMALGCGENITDTTSNGIAGSNYEETTNATAGNTSKENNNVRGGANGNQLDCELGVTTGYCKQYPEITNCNDCSWIAEIHKSGPNNTIQECDPKNSQFLQINSGPTPNPIDVNVIDNPSACNSTLTLTKIANIADTQNAHWFYAAGCRMISKDGVSVLDFGPDKWSAYNYNGGCVNYHEGSY